MTDSLFCLRFRLSVKMLYADVLQWVQQTPKVLRLWCLDLSDLIILQYTDATTVYILSLQNYLFLNLNSCQE